MTHRPDPWAGLPIRRIHAQPTATLKTWEELAKYHSEERSRTVIHVLLNAVVVKQMRRLESQTFSASLLPDAEAYDDDTVDDLRSAGAGWQLPGGSQPEMVVPPTWQERLDALQADEAVRDGFKIKATSPVEAHCIPCAIEWDGVRLESLIEQALTVRTGSDLVMGTIAARTPFGKIDVLPLIFNEADSHAERVGLKRALLDACQSIPSGLSSPCDAEIFDRVERSYRQWVSGALAALDETIRRNRDRLARAQSSNNKMQIIYREAKLVILEGYRSAAETAPRDLLNPGAISSQYALISRLLRDR